MACRRVEKPSVVWKHRDWGCLLEEKNLVYVDN